MLWNPNEPEAKAPKADGIQGRNQRDEIFKYPKVFELEGDDDEDYDDDYETTVVRKRRQDRDSNPVTSGLHILFFKKHRLFQNLTNSKTNFRPYGMMFFFD